MWLCADPAVRAPAHGVDAAGAAPAHARAGEGDAAAQDAGAQDALRGHLRLAPRALAYTPCVRISGGEEYRSDVFKFDPKLLRMKGRHPIAIEAFPAEINAITSARVLVVTAHFVVASGDEWDKKSPNCCQNAVDVNGLRLLIITWFHFIDDFGRYHLVSTPL